uniref:Coiled-coil domain-containing protein 134 n=1 Tax=Timema tahoe TaxID=61484 RepID=A0A7R9I9W6_9NEOP|nr:unnamed protein product [Timema tahoe]
MERLTWQLYIVIMIGCFTTVLSQNEDNNSKLSDNKHETGGMNTAEQLFTRLFKKRRVEQLDAVKGLLAMKSYEKQYKMVTAIAEKVFTVIQSSRVVLEGSDYIPGISVFPEDEHTLDALSNILENTALFGDVLLRLPEISQQIFSKKHEWEVLYGWSLNFCSQTSLLDRQTARLVNLVNQELNYTERKPDYVNPYQRKQLKSNKISKDDAIPKKTVKKKKKEYKKGPRMTLGEL